MASKQILKLSLRLSKKNKNRKGFCFKTRTITSTLDSDKLEKKDVIQSNIVSLEKSKEKSKDDKV